MTYQELFNKLTPDQMSQQIAIFIGDEEEGRVDIGVEISEEDFYWDCNDCIGNLEQVKADNPTDWEEVIEDVTCCPKGTVTMHIFDTD